MTGNILLLFLILWPMAGGVLCFSAGRSDNRLRDRAAVTVALVELAAALWSYKFLGAELFLKNVCGLGLRFKLDGFRLIYSIVTAYIWTAAEIFAGEYLEHAHNRNRYHLFVLLTLGSVMGVFLSDSLFTTFVFFELMSLFSCTLVIHDETPEAVHAAKLYLAFAIAGGLMAFTGLVLLYAKTGTLDISALTGLEDRESLYVAGGLIFAGFAVKASVFPVHIWLPPAHTTAPAPFSALLSGLLTKTGLFGVLVLTAGPFLHDPRWGLGLLLLALLTMVLGAVLALFSVNLKRTLACSSMSQLGFILFGVAMQCFLGPDNDLAVRGTILYMVGHSLIKLVLFLSAGVVYMNTHRLDLNGIQGFGRGKPLFLFAFLMGILGLVGMPLWNGYLGKTLIHEAAAQHISPLGLESELALFRFSEWVFLISGGLTAAYAAKLFVMLFAAAPAPGALVGVVGRRYLRPINAAVLALSAAILPLLGCLPYRLADPISFLGAPFLNGPPGHDKVGYFAWGALKGAAISLGLGAGIYLLVRVFLMRKREGRLVCLDVWPRWLSLERLFYRPIFIGVLPFLGALTARVLDLVTAAPVAYALAHAAEVRFVRVPEDEDFGVYHEGRASFQTLLPSTLAYSLLAFIVGALCLLTWMLLNR